MGESMCLWLWMCLWERECVWAWVCIWERMSVCERQHVYLLAYTLIKASTEFWPHHVINRQESPTFRVGRKPRSPFRSVSSCLILSHLLMASPGQMLRNVLYLYCRSSGKYPCMTQSALRCSATVEFEPDSNSECGWSGIGTVPLRPTPERQLPCRI